MAVALGAGMRPLSERFTFARVQTLTRSLGIMLVLGLAACQAAESPTTSAPAAGRLAADVPVHRDIAELERVKMHPRACDSNSACPDGSHCDDAAHECQWECLSDSDCGARKECTPLGTCVAQTVSAGARRANDSADCIAIPAEDRRAVLLTLAENQVICDGDDSCPCGSFCGSDGVCRVNCGEGLPGLICASGQVCTPLGRCAAGPSAPPGSGPATPSIQLELGLEPGAISANTVAAPVLRDVDVVVTANSLEVLKPEHPAVVRLGFAEERNETPGLMPRVRCTPNASLSTSCLIAGGWHFDVANGNLVSSPQRIQVEIPRTTTPLAWSLEARSEWAATPAAISVSAQPKISRSSDINGRFAGVLAWRHKDDNVFYDAYNAPKVENIPIELAVTPDFVTVFEPTRIIFPDGHAVLSRDQSKTTMLTWLSTDVPNGASLKVMLDLNSIIFDPNSSKLSLSAYLTTWMGSVVLTAQLQRTGDFTAAACAAATASTCGVGNYCNIDLQRCLPGSAPTGAVTVDKTSAQATPTSAFRNRTFDDWLHAIRPMVQGNAQLAGTDVTGIERAYCFRPQQATPARLGERTLELSGDLACADNAAQTTFDFLNHTKAAEFNTQGEQTLNLLGACLADFKKTPPTAAPFNANTMLANGDCASLGRFFTALAANASENVQLGSTTQRLVHHLLKQWLSVNAFIAHTAVEDKGFDDLRSGNQTPPAEVRLGEMVDAVERGLLVLLDSKILAQYMNGVDANNVDLNPDYFVITRPVAQWIFDEQLPATSRDIENHNDLAITGTYSNTAPNQRYLLVTPTTGGERKTLDAVSLPDRGFSLVGFVAASSNGTTPLLEKRVGGARTFWIDLIWSNTVDKDWVRIEARDSSGGLAAFRVPYQAGYFAFVVDGSSYKLYRVSDGTTAEYAPTTVSGGGPHWGEPGVVHLVPTIPGNGVILDTISLWPRPLSREAVTRMGGQVSAPDGKRDYTSHGIPPQTPTDPTQEQTVGLAVYLFEALNAQLDLLMAYMEAERGAMYGECYLGGPSPSRDRAIARVSRAMRLGSMLENEAYVLARAGAPDVAWGWSAPGAATQPWFARYEADRKQFLAKRVAATELLVQAQKCINPLGIGEEDLPLFHGETVGASERFFASSRYLAGQARLEAGAAGTKVANAQNGYIQQSQLLFQQKLEQVDKDERLRKLRLQYETQLRRYCGAPPQGQKLLPGFLDGSLTAANCFIKTNVPGCSNPNTRLRDMKAECLRGEMGDQVLAIQTASIDATNADNSLTRATNAFDSDEAYCARRQKALEQDDAALVAHHEFMQQMRVENERRHRSAGLLRGLVSDFMDAVTLHPSLNTANAIDASEVEHDANEQHLYEDLFEDEMRVRSTALEVAACFHQADNQKFAIDAAHDVVDRATHDVGAALVKLSSSKDELIAMADDAKTEIEAENALNRAPPGHLLWVTDDIQDFKFHMNVARRLTYLALRAFEYEAQLSTGRRSEVLTARKPEDLLRIVTMIEAATAPMNGGIGFTIGQADAVLSLRDEILGFEDLTTHRRLAPGETARTPTEAFRAYLKSDAAKIYKDGVYLGRGVRFQLKPSAWSETSCAERTWRVSSALQLDASNQVHNARLTLFQENSFASQECSADVRGSLVMARLRPRTDLLLGDSGFVTTKKFDQQYTSMNIDGLLDKDRHGMESLPEGIHSGFAGRGLYGNYVLLFPSGLVDANGFLDNITDVLLRFDFVELTNASL